MKAREAVVAIALVYLLGAGVGRYADGGGINAAAQSVIAAIGYIAWLTRVKARF